MKINIHRLPINALLCLLLIQEVAALTQIDYYYSLCSSLVATNGAYKCKGKQRRTQNMTCQCTDLNFARSLYICMNEAASRSGVPDSLGVSWNAYNHLCHKKAGMGAPSLLRIAQSVALDPVKQSFQQANASRSGDFYTPPEMIIKGNLPKAGISIYQEAYACIHWGQGLLGYVFGIMFIKIVFNLISWLIPSATRMLYNSALGRVFRRFFSMPALVNVEHAEPFMVLKYWPLMLPLRLEAILIIGLYATVIGLLAANFKIELSPYASPDKSTFITDHLALRCAWYAMYMFVPTFLFAGRNNFLIWLTGWQHSSFIVFHKHMARLCTLLIVIHASCWTVMFSNYGTYGEHWHFKYFIMGFVAIMCMGLMCIQAVKFLRSKAYDIFIHIHFALAVVFCGALWEHLKSSDVCYEMLYTMIALWGFDRICRIVKIILNKPGILCEVKDFGDVMVLKIRYSDLWRPVAGSYVFVHFLHPIFFTQSHPFTALYGTDDDPNDSDSMTNVMTLDDGMSGQGSTEKVRVKERTSSDKGYVKLFIRKQKGITQSVAKRQNWRVLLDGPYGVQFNIQPYHELVFIAGGIGITGVYSHLKHALDTNSGRIRSVSLYWSVRDLSCLVWFHNELVTLKKYPLLNIHIYVSNYEGKSHTHNPISRYFHKHQKSLLEDDETMLKISHWDNDESMHNTIKTDRLDIGNTVLDHIENSHGPVCFFSCGPGKMCDDARRYVTLNLHRTKNFVQYEEEAFAF